MNATLEKLLPWCRREGECLVWQGRFTDWAPAMRAIMAEEISAPVPGAMRVEATCGTRLCLAVEHLVLVPLDPEREGGLKQHEINSLKTTCPHGHPYDKANTRWEKDGRGRLTRKCRTCGRIRAKVRRAVKII